MMREVNSYARNVNTSPARACERGIPAHVQFYILNSRFCPVESFGLFALGSGWRVWVCAAMGGAKGASPKGGGGQGRNKVGDACSYAVRCCAMMMMEEELCWAVALSLSFDLGPYHHNRVIIILSQTADR